jgi:hypothetical protein
MSNLNLDLLNPKFDLAKKQIWCKFEQQCKKSGEQKNNLTNAKFRKEGKEVLKIGQRFSYKDGIYYNFHKL